MSSPRELEASLRTQMLDMMPIEHAPAHVRLAFHDAGTYDAATQTGGAHGTTRLRDELQRADNTGWGQVCFELLHEVKLAYAEVSWADLIAIAGAAAIVKCGGPVIEVGLGRTDGDEPAPPHRLPGGYEGAGMLKRIFARMGLGPRELVALSGAHSLGHSQRRPFTPEPLVFSNRYFRQLMAQREIVLLGTDTALLDDPELRPFVELYAADNERFLADFADAYTRLTWLGNQQPCLTD